MWTIRRAWLRAVLTTALLAHATPRVHAARLDPRASLRGTVFIPGAILSDVIAELQRTVPPAGQDDILDSRLLKRGPDRMSVYLRLQRHKLVTVVYDTEPSSRSGGTRQPGPQP